MVFNLLNSFISPGALLGRSGIASGFDNFFQRGLGTTEKFNTFNKDFGLDRFVAGGTPTRGNRYIHPSNGGFFAGNYGGFGSYGNNLFSGLDNVFNFGSNRGYSDFGFGVNIF